MERMTVPFKDASQGEKPFLASERDKKIISIGLLELIKRSMESERAACTSLRDDTARTDHIDHESFEVWGRYYKKSTEDQHWVSVSMPSAQENIPSSYAQVGEDRYSFSDPEILLNNFQDAEIHNLSDMTEADADRAIAILVDVARLIRSK